MPEFQYSTVPGKLSEVFSKIRSVGVPPKATVQWLKSIGFTSSNDTSLLSIIRAINFADQSGSPTDYWKQYRGGDHKAVMARAIREYYRELFEVYSDANARSDKDLENFFSTRSTAGKQSISKTISTFKNLVSLGDFSGEAASHVPAGGAPPAKVHHSRSTVTPASPNLHIDVQIHISADATAQQIDQIFASMAKHLYGKRDE